MAKICTTCQHSEKYSFKLDNCEMKYGDTICNGKLIDIDDLLIPSITELWNKGYETESSCSGHPYDNYIHIYILFSKNYSTINNNAWLTRFNNIVIGDKLSLQLNFNFNANDTIFYKMNELTKAHKSLYNYIKSLPSIK